MRKPNLAIQRTNFPIPTIVEIDVHLNGACLLSKLDVRKAFHQVELDETSRYITTFITHEGLFPYKRLNFETNAATEIFQSLLQRYLGDIEGVLNKHDDIIVFGKDREEHNVPSDKCLQHLEDIGLTLNQSKCKFLQTGLPFFGHVYSKEGINPDYNRIYDIVNLDPPSNTRLVILA